MCEVKVWKKRERGCLKHTVPIIESFKSDDFWKRINTQEGDDITSSAVLTSLPRRLNIHAWPHLTAPATFVHTWPQATPKALTTAVTQPGALTTETVSVTSITTPQRLNTGDSPPSVKTKGALWMRCKTFSSFCSLGQLLLIQPC